MVLARDHLNPRPETDEVLAEVKAKGYLMAALRNGDEAMLRALQAQLSTPLVISSLPTEPDITNPTQPFMLSH